ncbi:hypothetical protein PAPYR_9526 [Paratrimastix pyriformis]|uniref:B30.2/SPRY domain-containing protein n=1 Tax=Paratrimastix pyriformis TaxID=342808 RepID=A0ABQ8U853_9EUKA|nr:hypothetical protein PAPYR_9526 [Paratrimastix pyriformis]
MEEGAYAPCVTLHHQGDAMRIETIGPHGDDDDDLVVAATAGFNPSPEEAPYCWAPSRTHRATVDPTGHRFEVTFRGDRASSVIGRVGWTEGVHEWAIKLDRKGEALPDHRDIYLGICPEEAFSPDGYTNVFGWGVDRHGAAADHERPVTEVSPQRLAFRQGDTIRFRLDMEAGTLAIAVGTEPLRVVFRFGGLPAGMRLFPCATCHKAGDCICLMAPVSPSADAETLGWPPTDLIASPGRTRKGSRMQLYRPSIPGKICVEKSNGQDIGL